MSGPMSMMQVIGPEEMIMTIRSARFVEEFIEPIRQVLERHGASVTVFNKACVITLPEGTVRQRLYPVVLTDRYKVTLPDGYCLYQHTSIHIEGYGNVYFLLDEFPAWVQDRYGVPTGNEK